MNNYVGNNKKSDTFLYVVLFISASLFFLLHMYILNAQSSDSEKFEKYLEERHGYELSQSFSSDITKNEKLNDLIKSNLYRVAVENYSLLRIVFSLICISSLFLFLFWLYGRFGKYLSIIIGVLIHANVYLLFASIDIYAPNLVIYLSFIFIIIFCEYSIGTKYSKYYAFLMFPFATILAQFYFILFFSIVLPLIVYNIIYFRTKTKRYIKPVVIGFILSLIILVPNFIIELEKGFPSINSQFIFNSQEKPLSILKAYSMLLLPTADMSFFYGNQNTLNYFFSNRNFFLTFVSIISFSTTILSIFALCFAFISSIREQVKRRHMHVLISSKILHNAINLYVLSIPITLLVFLIFRSGAGSYYYLYNTFAFSVVPSIILVKYILDNKGIVARNILCIFSLLVFTAFTLKIIISYHISI